MKYEIFPTHMWIVDGAPQGIVDELYKTAYTCRDNVESSSLSNIGGYQSHAFRWEEFFPQGREYVHKVLGDIFEDFRVQSWWYNINSKGDSNKPHIHSASDYALVWYLTDSNEKLVLINPIQRLLSQEQTASPYANKGDILIFPADIMHYVLANDKEDDRICISMNISIRDKYS